MTESLFLLLFFVVFPALMVGAILWEGARARIEERDRHKAELDRLGAAHEGERERLAARVQYLEFQLANHVAHVLKLPPPAPPPNNGPKPEPLPEIMVKFLEAIEGEEERAEFESDFRAQLALGIDPHLIVSRAMSAARG